MTKLDNFFLKATKQQQTGALFNKAGTLISRGRVVIFMRMSDAVLWLFYNKYYYYY